MAEYLHLFETEEEFQETRSENYKEPWVSYTLENEEVNYNKSEYEKLLETPLTFEITSGGNITWSYYNDGDYEDAHATIYYKKNDGEWTEMPRTLAVVSGDTVQFKGDNEGYGDSDMGDGYFNSFSEETTAGFTLKGNIMSLIDSTGFTTASTLPTSYYQNFNSLFYGCTGLTSAENLVLPATALTSGCYQLMFYGCTSLTSAPELPATTLTSQCYEYMFQGCTSLTQAPELPAETLASYCYCGMFYDCTGLTLAPELPATALTSNCYSSMFADCTSLIQAPALPATTLAYSCYSGMFNGCTSLTSAPVLPATTLTNYCYRYMFSDCTSLTSAPELPATTLATNCYGNMFNGCTNLNYIKCLATNISASNSRQNWVFGVQTTSGTFVKAAGISESTWGRGNNGIPTNWTVQGA